MCKRVFRNLVLDGQKIRKKMLCFSLLQKPREEDKCLLSLFQQSNDLGTLVACCDPVGIHSDYNIWEISFDTRELCERNCLIPKAGF